MIEGFRAAITRKPQFFGQKMPVFLGPDWSDIGPHTLFSGCWTQNSVFFRVLRQMIKGLGATITKNPHFLPKNANFLFLKQHFWGMSGQL